MGNYKKNAISVFFLMIFFVYGHFSAKIPFVSAENSGKTFFFKKNLKIGDRNEDVRELQKILNKNDTTRVSSYGVGSTGNETDFFGQLTKNAVIRFQELYASDILAPSGLGSGTGFVGESTRLKLNSLSGNTIGNNQTSSISKSDQIQTKTSNNSSSSVSYKVISEPDSVSVRVYNTSEYQVLPESTVILTGEGFDSLSNTVFLGENFKITNLASAENGTKISFVVPKDIPLGKYNISVKNINGKSENQNFNISLIITDSPAKRPVVGSIYPSPALYDGEITISGSGFTSSENAVYSSFGNSFNLPSPDGKTLKLKTSSLSEIHRLYNIKDLFKGENLEGYLYVSNENGVSKIPSVFYVKM